MAQTTAKTIWEASAPASATHPYLVKKGIGPFGARQKSDKLVLPLRDAGGVVHSLHFIDGSGQKRFLKGGRVRGCYFAIGNPQSVICIAEGFATAATIHEATGHATAVAFNAGNLMAVGRALRARFRDVELRFCADDDRHTRGNPGLNKALYNSRTGQSPPWQSVIGLSGLNQNYSLNIFRKWLSKADPWPPMALGGCD